MFRILCTAAATATLLFAGIAGAQQGVGSAVLAQAAAATRIAKADYAFDLEISSAKLNWRARFDPAQRPGLRLVQPRREDLANDERRAFDRMAAEFDGVSWCASEQMARVADVRLLREDAASAVYAFQPTPESIRGEQAGRFASRLRGEATIDKSAGDITRVRLFTPEAFSPFPLVRVDSADIAISCATAPNGRRYAAETVTVLRGSAFGSAFNERSVQRARNLSAI
jgi:hypothetical protein